MTDKTKEQLAAEKLAEKETKAAAKATEKQAKAEQKEAERKTKAEAKVKEKAEKATAKTAEIAAKKAEKDEANVARKKERDDKTAARKAEKETKAAERQSNQMPEQHGIRRPRPGTVCGNVWGLADKLSGELSQPVPIANLLEAATAEKINEATCRTQYARWRVYNSVTGRVSLPKVEAPKETAKK